MTELDLAESMQTSAQAAVHWAREMFGTTLDFSEDSLPAVERILQQLGDRRPKSWFANLFSDRSTGHKNTEIAMVWGSYVGEVMRRQWGGEWRSERKNRVSLWVNGSVTFPVEMVYNYLTNRSQDSVCVMYNCFQQSLTQQTTPTMRPVFHLISEG